MLAVIRVGRHCGGAEWDTQKNGGAAQLRQSCDNAHTHSGVRMYMVVSPLSAARARDAQNPDV